MTAPAPHRRIDKPVWHGRDFYVQLPPKPQPYKFSAYQSGDQVVLRIRKRVLPMQFTVEQTRQEVRFGMAPLEEVPWSAVRNEAMVRIDEWVESNLPYVAALPPLQKKVKKAKLRQWLNKNATQRWTFVEDGIAFESQIDGTFYKLYWL